MFRFQAKQAKTIELPYITDYAKSNRSHCRNCHGTIAKDTLRLGVMVQAAMFDGRHPQWYHEHCFFDEVTPKTVGDIENFGTLRYDDQQRLKREIEGDFSPVEKKRKVADLSQEEYGVEYCRSKHSVCHGCKHKFQKDLVRIKSTVYDESAEQYDHDLWHHPECFVEHKKYGFDGKGQDLPGFDLLEKKDQDFIKKVVARKTFKNNPYKKLPVPPVDTVDGANESIVLSSSDSEDEGGQDDVDKLIAKQQKEYYEIFDQLKQANMKKDDLISLLEANKQSIPMKGGASVMLERICDMLTFGALEKCPCCFGGQYVFHNFNYMCTGRVSSTVKCLNTTDNPRRSKAKIPKKIKEKYEFFTAFKPKKQDRAVKYISPSKETLKAKKRNAFSSTQSSTSTASSSLSAGPVDSNAVDPLSEMEGIAHVFKDQTGLVHSAMLNKVDIQAGRNSYYKLQLLEANYGKNFCYFKSWGRIGTDSGSHKTVEASFDEAEALFEEDFVKFTGIQWKKHVNHAPVPGRYCVVETDVHDEQKAMNLNSIAKIKSNLAAPVQDLVKMLFDINRMKDFMSGCKIDMKKMPLGRLSQSQLREGFKVLVRILEMMEECAFDYEYIEESNKFYSLIPHNFGYAYPPTINTKKQVNKLTEMLNCLIEIEKAYTMMNADGDGSLKNPIDLHYQKLKTDIGIVERTSEEFKMLEKYVINTHGATHSEYNLEIEEIYKVRRENEQERFEPFKNLHNRKLLWHGSQLINFAGILSNGLKIAPPDVPSSGYMFGKGLYFADMVSKSANYCRTTRDNNTGLLLLCEVALGNMMELNTAKYIQHLPQNIHSVKGCGITTPDLKESFLREDGVEVPLGRANKPDLKKITNQQALIYNEYIVYDVAQVHCEYLFKMNFKYK